MSSHRSAFPRPKLRGARRDDAPAIVRLLRRAARIGDGVPRASQAEIAALLSVGQFLVLDVGGGEVGAACLVATHGGAGHVRFLVVDPILASRGIEEQMCALAAALCEAFTPVKTA